MNRYLVTIPFAGAVNVMVECDDESEAKEQAFKKLQDIHLMNWQELNKADADIQEWDYFEQLVQGNVLYAPVNTLSIELEESDIDND